MIQGIQFDIQGLAIRLRNDLALATTQHYCQLKEISILQLERSSNFLAYLKLSDSRENGMRNKSQPKTKKVNQGLFPLNARPSVIS